MRRLSVLLAAAALTPAGCLFSPKPSPKPPVPAHTEKIAERKADDFVTYLNRQAGHAQTIRYNDLDLKVSLPGQGFIPTLGNGMLVCGQPNNLRMTAGMALGGKQLDVGANDAEMWMYVKMAPDPYMYVPNADFAAVQERMPVKFEPGWVMQAVGMATYDPNKQYTVTVDDKSRSYLLGYPDTTAGGQRVRKVTEFAADRMSGSSPQVRRHTVYTEDGKSVIAEARVRRVSEQVLTDPQTKEPVVLQVPTEVSLEWPGEQTKMDLILGRISVNERMTPNEFDDTFKKPARIGGQTPRNLADVLRR